MFHQCFNTVSLVGPLLFHADSTFLKRVSPVGMGLICVAFFWPSLQQAGCERGTGGVGTLRKGYSKCRRVANMILEVYEVAKGLAEVYEGLRMIYRSCRTVTWSTGCVEGLWEAVMIYPIERNDKLEQLIILQNCRL